MREWTLEQIQERVTARSADAYEQARRFRQQSIEEGWSANRTRPRSPDEIRALDLLLRQMFLDAKASGKITYDREKRVMIFADVRTSEARTAAAENSDSV